jgi:hypothetical protein
LKFHVVSLGDHHLQVIQNQYQSYEKKKRGRPFHLRSGARVIAGIETFSLNAQSYSDPSLSATLMNARSSVRMMLLLLVTKSHFAILEEAAFQKDRRPTNSSATRTHARTHAVLDVYAARMRDVAAAAPIAAHVAAVVGRSKRTRDCYQEAAHQTRDALPITKPQQTAR